MANKYRKKPVVVEAMPFDGYREKLEAWIKAGDGQCGNWLFNGAQYSSFMIFTLEGMMTVELGDWIIKGVKGEFYPCKPDIFEASYKLEETD